MRATLITFIFTITLALLALANAHDDVCNGLSNCSDCLARKNCGWCSDWNGCMSGSGTGPWKGTCSAWHQSTCVGVSIPRQSKCPGNPISPGRVRQLIGAGNSYATIATNAKWTDQSRKCNSVTGCSDWIESTSTPPISNVSLLVTGGLVALNIETGDCTEHCNSYGYRIPELGNRLIGIQSNQVGQKSLTFDKDLVPEYLCRITGCNAYDWKAPSGTTEFKLIAEMTDNCLRVASNSSSPHDVDYIELLVKF